MGARVLGAWTKKNVARSSKEKKNLHALRSLRNSAAVVTPKFREKRGGRREKNAIFTLVPCSQSGAFIRSEKLNGVEGAAVAMETTATAVWREDEEELKVEGVKAVFRPKPRFSYNEVKLLLEAVKKNRFVLLRKFNQGVSAETKKQTWSEITEQINGLGENHRQVRQIMKKWADLKCDGKRRIAALRGPNGSQLNKKKLGHVEKMVHKILMMSPEDGDSDVNLEDEDFPAPVKKGPTPTANPYSYLSLTDSSPQAAAFEVSPASSPDKDLGDAFHSSSDLDVGDDGEPSMDFEENDDPMFSGPPALPLLPPSPSPSLDTLSSNALLRTKPVHTYSRNSQNQTQTQTAPRPPPGPSSSAASTSAELPSSLPPAASDAASSSSLAAPSSSSPVVANGTSSHPEPATSSIPLPPPPPPPPPSSSSSSSAAAPPTSASSSNSQQRPSSSSVLRPKDQPSSSSVLPEGSVRRPREQVAQLASQSLQQQRASRMLLASVSQSLEALAQSVQLLVESQQEFVQESLVLQRETVEILRDFSNTTLKMLRDKGSAGHPAAHHPQHSAQRF